MIKILTAREAVSEYIKDGVTLASGGFVGAMHPEEISIAIQDSFLETNSPKDITLVYAAGQGGEGTKGLNHMGEEGLCSRVIGGHWGLAPRLQKLALENKLAAYNLPQGVISQLYRDIAAKKLGLITHVGLNTFVDPRLEGGKLNQKAEEAGDIVEIINIKGEERLLYNAIPIDVVMLKGTFSDTEGNITFHKEGVSAESLAMAQAAKNCGGHVIVQVEKVVDHGTLDSRLVKIPGIYVDAVVIAKPENHMQTFSTQYNPAYCGEARVPMDSLEPLPLNERKIIARRAAMELVPKAITNLGIGMPEGIASVAAEEGVKGMVLTTEAGTIGGVPAGGGDFGVTTNADCVLDQPCQFDFYDGGGLDVAFLGLAQMDGDGNINVSKFGPKIAGCGGFINITQNSKKVIFCGTFTQGGMKVAVENHKLKILQEGKNKKFLKHVEQITFSGDYARKIKQPVMYITERAVFQLTEEGVELTEIAPGIDIETQILPYIDFDVIVKDVKWMDERIFSEDKMGLEL
ncbi:MAG: 3-oxoacid CoA-transferase [Anaerostipes sp.]|nr:3-oxoacid CoA-transferase [Anaerostipes sp.]MDD4372196.1 3-oxoacid CoA-transferase [Anaerostipes sp.]